MTENNAYDRDYFSGPDMFQGDNNLYNSFLHDDIIKDESGDDTITIGEINNFNGFHFELDTEAYKKENKPPEQIDHSKDTYPHNYMKGTYDQQRRDRLIDVVDDYLNDDDKTAMDLYEDIKNALTENRNYFAKQKQKCDAVLSMLNGDNNPEFIPE
jgi:hypothetical protein